MGRGKAHRPASMPSHGLQLFGFIAAYLVVTVSAIWAALEDYVALLRKERKEEEEK